MQLKNELIDFQQKIQEYQKLLDKAWDLDDFSLQNILEDQIRKLKNQVDCSLAVREYLIKSQYIQLQNTTGSTDPIKD